MSASFPVFSRPFYPTSFVIIAPMMETPFSLQPSGIPKFIFSKKVIRLIAAPPPLVQRLPSPPEGRGKLLRQRRAEGRLQADQVVFIHFPLSDPFSVPRFGYGLPRLVTLGLNSSTTVSSTKYKFTGLLLPCDPKKWRHIRRGEVHEN